MKKEHHLLYAHAAVFAADEFPVLCLQETGLRCGTSPSPQIKKHVAILVNFRKMRRMTVTDFSSAQTTGRLPVDVTDVFRSKTVSDNESQGIPDTTFVANRNPVTYTGGV